MSCSKAAPSLHLVRFCLCACRRRGSREGQGVRVGGWRLDSPRRLLPDIQLLLETDDVSMICRGDSIQPLGALAVCSAANLAVQVSSLAILVLLVGIYPYWYCIVHTKCSTASGRIVHCRLGATLFSNSAPARQLASTRFNPVAARGSAPLQLCTDCLMRHCRRLPTQLQNFALLRGWTRPPPLE